MKPLKESDIQSAILDYLATTGLTFWRCSLGAVLVRRRQTLVFAKNPMKGFPDIGLIIPGKGRTAGIEVKRPGGALSPEQKVWQEKILAAGGAYCVATSVEDVRVFLAQVMPRLDSALDYEKSDGGKPGTPSRPTAIPFKYRAKAAP